MAKISNTTAYPQIATLDPADYLILTDAENQLMTKSCTVQQLQAQFGIDTLVAHVEVTSSQLQSLATSSKTIIAAPGTNKVFDVLSLAVYGQKGTTAYNFGNNLEFKCSTTVFATLPSATANGNADYATKLFLDGGATNIVLPANQPLVLTTSGNPSQGDGKLFVNVYYRILTLGTTF
jgi:hypothetical protein|tara:strand:+ start:6868 stop:7401 length:534 start_codon:yes stop_codon:yes gene_type:complete